MRAVSVALVVMALVLSGCTSDPSDRDRVGGSDVDILEDGEGIENEAGEALEQVLSRLDFEACVGAVGEFWFPSETFVLPLPNGFNLWTDDQGLGRNQFFGLDCESVTGNDGSDFERAVTLWSRIRVDPPETYRNESIPVYWLLLRSYWDSDELVASLDHWNLSTVRPGTVQWSDSTTPAGAMTTVSYSDGGESQQLQVSPTPAVIFPYYLSSATEANLDWDGEERITVLGTPVSAVSARLGGAELAPDHATGAAHIAGIGVRLVHLSFSLEAVLGPGG